MREFTQKWYDHKYFADPKGKRFVLSDGTVKHWGYLNPTGEYGGAVDIVKAWKTVFNPKNLLMFGAGRGQFIAYARDIGLKAKGFDWSKWACSDEGRYARCKPEWLKCHDATKPWPYKDDSFDLVVGLDILEHIYWDDVDFVISELFRVAKKNIFLQIATVDGVKEKGYVLKKGEHIPLAVDPRTWAGHVLVQTESAWYYHFDSEAWWPKRDYVHWFIGLVKENIIKNWLLNTIIILEKIE